MVQTEKEFIMKAEIVQPAMDGVPGMIGPLAERALVTEWEEVPLDGFRKIFSKKAEPLWPRSENLFKEYGPVLSVAVASLMMYANEDGKLDAYLGKLEGHLRDDLHYQHPDLRGKLIIAPATQNRSLIFVESLIRELRPKLFE
jgi:hypothetical protein